MITFIFKKCRMMALAVLPALLLAQNSLPAAGTNEPVYQGKPLSAWLKELSAPVPYQIVTNAPTLALRSMGTNALPYLLTMLRETNTGFGGNRWLGHRGLICLGEIASPAVPTLEKMMSERDLRDWAPSILAYVGKDGIQVLVSALTNRNVEIRKGAASCLGIPGELWSRKKLTYDMAGFERDMVPVVPALVRALRDEDWNVAYHAAQSLGKLRLKPEVVVPALVEVAADKKANSVLRGEAIDTLGQLGHSAESAVPALVEVAKDGPGIAKHVKDALRWIDPEAIKQVEQITPATWASNRTSRYKR